MPIVAGRLCAKKTPSHTNLFLCQSTHPVMNSISSASSNSIHHYDHIRNQLKKHREMYEHTCCGERTLLGTHQYHFSQMKQLLGQNIGKNEQLKGHCWIEGISANDERLLKETIDAVWQQDTPNAIQALKSYRTAIGDHLSAESFCQNNSRRIIGYLADKLEKPFHLNVNTCQVIPKKIPSNNVAVPENLDIFPRVGRRNQHSYVAEGHRFDNLNFFQGNVGSNNVFGDSNIVEGNLGDHNVLGHRNIVTGNVGNSNRFGNGNVVGTGSVGRPPARLFGVRPGSAVNLSIVSNQQILTEQFRQRPRDLNSSTLPLVNQVPDGGQ